jgi:general nucleoside transport system permease protein
MLNELLEITILVSILGAAIRIATPLILSAMGELVIHRAGILNLGVEGSLLMGAFTGFLVAEQTGSSGLALIAAMVSGGLMSLLLVFMSTTLKINQTVAGLSLNLFASGFTLYLYRTIYAEFNPSEIPMITIFKIIKIPFLSQIPFLGEILFSQQALTYLAFIMVPVVAFFLYRSRHGLIIRSIGENPRAADMQGRKVGLYQYLGVIFGGMMSGLGGSFLTLGASAKFVPDISAGRGWLVLVIIIAGNWKPARILAAALFFAFLDAVQLQIQGVGVQIPYQYLLMIPYIFAIVAVMGSKTKGLRPGHLGMPYHRE